MSNDRTRRTPKKRDDWAPRFLEALEDSGMVSEAAKVAGVGRSTVYDRREVDEAFADAWDDVIELATERMEREAHRRAVEGVDKPIYHQGVLVDTIRTYSDTLLIFLLKARRPAVYREHHRHEHVGGDGGPVGVRVELSEKQNKALDELLRARPATGDA